METLFQDEYINNKVLKRLIKEVKKEQISRTVRNIDYFFKIRKKLNSKYDILSYQKDEQRFLKQFKNAGTNL